MGSEMKKSASLLRWPILLLACFMYFGSYYSFDIPAALKTQMEEYMGSANYETYFSLLYSLYAAPNIILPLFGGFFVDDWGVRVCLVLFTVLITVGQVIFSVGLMVKSWPILLLGRLVFGLGGESLNVAISALLADWFQGRELAFAFGLNLSIPRMGSVLNNIVSPRLALSVGLAAAAWAGTLLCVFSVGTVLIALPIDRAFDKPLVVEHVVPHNASSDTPLLAADVLSSPTTQSETGDSVGVSSTKTDDEVKEMCPGLSWKNVLDFPYVFWVLIILTCAVYGAVIPFNNVSSALLLERDFFQTPPSGCALTDPYSCQSATNAPNDLCPSRNYQPPLPMNVTVAGVYYPAVFPSDVDCTSSAWSDGCTSDYCSILADAQARVGVVMSIPYFISVFASPPIGLLIDIYGQRANIATLACAILIVTHMLLGLTTIGAAGLLVGQGLVYTGFAAVLWPTVPLVVPEERTGLAFGLVTCAYNLACFVVPLAAAAVYEGSGELYIPNVEMLFASLGIVGFIAGLYLIAYDYKNDSVLNRTSASALLAIEECGVAEVDGGGKEAVADSRHSYSNNHGVYQAVGEV